MPEPHNKPQRKTPEKIVASSVVRRKKPLSRKFADFFTPSDARSVGGHVYDRIVRPSLQQLLFDAGQGLLGGIIFGDDSSRFVNRARTVVGQSTNTAYHLASSSGAVQPQSRQMTDHGRRRFDFDEIIMASRPEAEAVLSALGDIHEEYGMVRVADLYGLVDITGHHTDDKWGWFDLAGTSISRVAEGYLLNLPKPVPLD